MPCEFFLIRYVPDVVKGEFVNIGVVLRQAAQPANQSGGPAGGRDGNRSLVRFTRDWARVRCLDAEADIALLEGVEQEIAQRLAQGVSLRDPRAVVESLEDSLSNSMQISEPRGTLAENLVTEMELLLRMYVEPLKVAKLRTRGARATIQWAMRTEFERAGVWSLMDKRIAAAPFTRPGDPLRIDCGYGPVSGNGSEALIRMFHAVSLEGDIEAAKGLAFSAPQLREGVRRLRGMDLHLTAVVETLAEDAQDPDHEVNQRHRFGIAAMEDREIRVITAGQLEAAARTAARELGFTT
jgi:hypothetical protein